MKNEVTGKIRAVKGFISHSQAGLLIFLEIVVGSFLSLVFLFLFLALTDGVLEKQVLTFDVALSRLIYAYRTPTLTQFMSLVTNLGSAPLIAIGMLVIVLLCFQSCKRGVVFFLFTLLTGVTLNLLLKLIFRVPRPDISPLEIATIYSFPSGHAMNSTVFYGSVAFLLFHFTRHKKLAVVVTILASVLILLVGASRIYLGVHYPSDVLASYLVGLLWLLICLLFECTLRILKFCPHREWENVLSRTIDRKRVHPLVLKQDCDC